MPQPEAVQLRQRKGLRHHVHDHHKPGRPHRHGRHHPARLGRVGQSIDHRSPGRPGTWSITDPNGDEHRGREYLNGRLELLQEAIDQLADELYTETSPICRRGTTRHRPLEKKNPSRNYHRQPGQRTVGQLRWVMRCRRHGGSSGQYSPRLKRVSPGTSFAARRPCWWRRKR